MTLGGTLKFRIPHLLLDSIDCLGDAIWSVLLCDAFEQPPGLLEVIERDALVGHGIVRHVALP